MVNNLLSRKLCSLIEKRKTETKSLASILEFLALGIEKKYCMLDIGNLPPDTTKASSWILMRSSTYLALYGECQSVLYWGISLVLLFYYYTYRKEVKRSLLTRDSRLSR